MKLSLMKYLHVILAGEKTVFVFFDVPLEVGCSSGSELTIQSDKYHNFE